MGLVRAGGDIAAGVQWSMWALSGRPAALDAVVLGAFFIVGLAGAIATAAGAQGDRPAREAAVLLVLNACAAAVVGRIALTGAAGALAADGWLVALAGAHLAAVGLSRRARRPLSSTPRRLAIGIAVALADVAFGLTAHGIVLAAGWGAAAIGFAWLARRSDGGDRGELLLEAGAGAHIGLVLIRALIASPPGAFGGAALAPMLTVAILATCAIACGRLAGARRAPQRMALDALGLVAIAYLTASGVAGPALVVTWALEALALIALAARTGDPVARLGGLGFLGAGSGVHANVRRGAARGAHRRASRPRRGRARASAPLAVRACEPGAESLFLPRACIGRALLAGDRRWRRFPVSWRPWRSSRVFQPSVGRSHGNAVLDLPSPPGGPGPAQRPAQASLGLATLISRAATTSRRRELRRPGDVCC